MPIVFEEVTGEVANQRTSGADTRAPNPDPAEDMRETVLRELALIQERQARLFAD